MATQIRRGSKIRGFTFLTLFTIFLIVSGYAGCAKDDPEKPGDQTKPEITIIYPTPPPAGLFDVADSVNIVARARDNNGIASVQFYRKTASDTAAKNVGTVIETPDSTENGWSYYSVKWRTGTITNGSEVKIIARADDIFGNTGFSPEIDVRILNVAQLTAPTAGFLIDPPSGNLDINFEFNASNETTDPIDELSNIIVRWDFEDDGIWDIDTTEHKTPLDLVYHKFVIPTTPDRPYRIRMEAYNTYYEGPGSATQNLEVTNVGGTPRPQSEMIRIPGGRYAIGVADTSDTLANTNEMAFHQVTVSTYYIEKNEVTNDLFRTYLNKAINSNPQAVIFYPPRTATDTLGNRLINFDESKIRFDVEEEIDSFVVAEGFEGHPVMGVSWYGATAYSIFYGLRLPTEREWEIAARGDSLGWRYPWGRDWDKTRCNGYNGGDPFELVMPPSTPIGFYDGSIYMGYQTNLGSSYFGLNDMAGNAKEWVRDWYENPYRQTPPPNYPGPPTGVTKVIRGGSWLGGMISLRCTNREATSPETMAPQIGFRTAYTDY
ncbi:MAG: SUMF1/EgtB/PvdO family nonheme iron enzyme [Candidatus Eisenbacteria bacterium]|uniref:SUMF1/EgtB/PvdO family nonheme iron enzyme n=1 Tax=Eiseniibacteriota bacterium TaxID=2212470 RepID=A0A948RV84_UNCEI|nr:SUMF1/EgtB/PvdO family nonheme iron enzyme [Candidatus Eisenbacteria bacterium]MBU1949461.1 SUMF1/EgtB/PvdO family nonheme iron enzyme [Candidatus Eisenbacteria bacterium]MBU2691638.1 SUMF1/EgtB/PvdO family nonheme iron enzyme [Candidatus Eisenbacteria bacterium]